MNTITTPKHYLYLPRAILFQLAGLIGIGTGGLASYGLKTYTNQRDFAQLYGASINNDSIAAAGGVVITSGALSGTAIGVLMIVLTLRPGHTESKRSVRIKEFLFLFLSSFALVAALTFSIITATSSAKLITTGLSQMAKAEVRAAAGNLRYRLAKVNIAISVLAWVSFLLLAVSSLLISRSARHVLHNGPQNGVEKSKVEKWCEPYVERVFGREAEGTRLESEENLNSMRS